jgi:hypothetical protein
MISLPPRRSYNAISPKMEAKRHEKADIAAGRVKIHSFECRFCHKKFKTTNPYLRYCNDSHRTAHLSQDNIEDYDRGHYARHHAIGGGSRDGDGFQ